MSFTPAPDNQLPVGTNMTFQGARWQYLIQEN
jgi:hypothetical protein